MAKIDVILIQNVVGLGAETDQIKVAVEATWELLTSSRT